MGIPATLANLLTQMNQNQEVLQGWDAVLNMLESSVNAFLQTQWNQHCSNTGQMTVSAIWCEGINKVGSTTFTNVYEYTFVLGAPLFQFPNGQANVSVTQNIQQGSFRSGTLVVQPGFNPATANLPYDDPNVTWSGPATIISPGANATISGTVALQQVQGYVNVSPTANSLVLNFAQGAFTLNHLAVAGIPPGEMIDQLLNWYATHNIQYVLFSIDTANHTGLPSFTPRAFQFNVVTTNAGNTVVQLFITTSGYPQANMTVNVNEPVPTADGLTCSLMISSRILYNDVLARSFSTPGATFNLVPTPPQGSGQIWHAVISPPFHFAGSFSFGSCCDRTTVTYSIYLGGTYSGSATVGFVLNQSITTTGNAPVQITVYAENHVSLGGPVGNQQITIVPLPPNIQVTGSQEGELMSDLQDILNGDFQNAMRGISFGPVTNFALYNLLFPGNLFNMTQAQVPGDLLIVGTFSPH